MPINKGRKSTKRAASLSLEIARSSRSHSVTEFPFAREKHRRMLTLLFRTEDIMQSILVKKRPKHFATGWWGKLIVRTRKCRQSTIIFKECSEL
jgi:hypothetical protein